MLLGPLYHLYTVADKQQALSEAIRVTKPGGIIFAAYVISDGCLLDEGFNRGNINVHEYIKMDFLIQKLLLRSPNLRIYLSLSAKKILMKLCHRLLPLAYIMLHLMV